MKKKMTDSGPEKIFPWRVWLREQRKVWEEKSRKVAKYGDFLWSLQSGHEKNGFGSSFLSNLIIWYHDVWSTLCKKITKKLKTILFCKISKSIHLLLSTNRDLDCLWWTNMGVNKYSDQLNADGNFIQSFLGEGEMSKKLLRGKSLISEKNARILKKKTQKILRRLSEAIFMTWKDILKEKNWTLAIKSEFWLFQKLKMNSFIHSGYLSLI